MKQPKIAHQPRLAPASPAAPARGSWRRTGALALLALVAAAGTWGFLEFVVWNRLPSALVGRWAVLKGPPEYHEAIFEFRRSGQMVGHLNFRDEVAVMKAEVRVDGDKLYSTTRHPKTGAEHVTVQTIRRLTAQELEVADDKGTVLTLARVN